MQNKCRIVLDNINVMSGAVLHSAGAVTGRIKSRSN